MLFSFYELCWHTGKTPDAWKRSETILFHNKGEVSDPANYRLIALQLMIHKLNSEPVGEIKPNQPFRYLGVDMTLTLAWKHQLTNAVAAIKEASEVWSNPLQANG